MTSWLQPTWVAGGSLRADGRAPLPWGYLPQQRFLADPDWDSPAFLDRYAEYFSSNYIAELLCRMAFLEPSANDLSTLVLPWEEPSFLGSASADTCHHHTGRQNLALPGLGRSAAMVYQPLYNGWSFGAPPARQRLDYHAGDGEEKLLADHPGTLIDLRGRTNLIQLAGACRKARAVVSVDAGPMHVAAGVATPTLAVVGNDAEAVGASPIRLWLPRSSYRQERFPTPAAASAARTAFVTMAVLPKPITAWKE